MMARAIAMAKRVTCIHCGDKGDGVKDMATHAMTGERGMMVATAHFLCVGLYVCGETTKNKEACKIVNVL
jgi:hypothetical protein